MTNKGWTIGGGANMFKERVTCPNCHREVINTEPRNARGGYVSNCPHCGIELFFMLWAEGELKEVGAKVAADQCFREGTWALERGNYEAAITLFDESTSKLPEDAPANGATLANKAVALRALGRTTEADECLDRSIAVNPNNAMPLTNKGTLLLTAGKPEEALGFLESALRIDPSHADAWLVKGLSLVEIGRRDEGIECIRRAYSLGSTRALEALSAFGVEPPTASTESLSGPRWKFWRRR